VRDEHTCSVELSRYHLELVFVCDGNVRQHPAFHIIGGVDVRVVGVLGPVGEILVAPFLLCRMPYTNKYTSRQISRPVG